MNITLTGASGLIGTHLQKRLSDEGHSIKTLSFRLFNKFEDQKDFQIPKKIENSILESLAEADAVIHLAGAPVSQAWTPKGKARIFDSRALGTLALAKALKKLQLRIPLISASGIGFYPDPSAEPLHEHDAPGNAFLSKVCQAWEAPVKELMEEQYPVFILRTGLVLSNRGGILPLIQKSAPWGIVPMTGSGQNAWSWIHIEDLTRLYITAAKQRLLPGIYNAVSPHVVSQQEFAETLLKAQKRTPWSFTPTVPAWLLKSALGERSQLPMTDQKVMAQALLQQGFSFEHSALAQALQDLKNRPYV